MLARTLLGSLPFLVPVPHSDFASAHNEFALALTRALAAQPGNLLVSPWSAASALGMVHEGARGTTAAELERVLRLPAEKAGAAFAELAQKLVPPPSTREGGPSYELGLANSVWVQQSFAIEPGFAERLRTGFAAEFRRVDFAKPAAAEINAWVEQATHGRILDLIDPGGPPPETRLVLVNAVWLKAYWSAPFTASATREDVFHTPRGDVRAKTMRRTGRYSSFGESERARVLSLEYKGGLEFLIVLPKESAGLADVLAREDLSQWTAKLAPAEVELQLPKFSCASTHELVPTLLALGVKELFDPERADLSGISKLASASDRRLFVDIVRQKAWIAVDEEGTEAAAATEVGIKVGSAAHRTSPVPFHVDHPFLYFLRHRDTGLVLFAGLVEDPTKT